MNKYTIDTDIVIELLRGNKVVTKRLGELPSGSKVCVTGINVYELYKGVYYLQDQTRKRDVEKFLDSVEVLELDRGAEEKGGKIYSDLRHQGKLINDADILIGAIAMVNESILVTNNLDHFRRIEGLQLEAWLR